MEYDKSLNTLVIGKDVFLDRRLAFAWPTPFRQGYWCLFGVKEEHTVHKDFPLILLQEGEREDREKLYEGIVAGAKKYHAGWMFADLGNEWEAMSAHFSLWLGRMNVNGLQLFDTSEISGIAVARPSIDAMARRKNLRISEKSVLWNQMAEMGPADMYTSVEGVKPEERFPAVYALSHIVMSYEYYPRKKSDRGREKIRPTEGYH